MSQNVQSLFHKIDYTSILLSFYPTLDKAKLEMIYNRNYEKYMDSRNVLFAFADVYCKLHEINYEFFSMLKSHSHEFFRFIKVNDYKSVIDQISIFKHFLGRYSSDTISTIEVLLFYNLLQDLDENSYEEKRNMLNVFFCLISDSEFYKNLISNELLRPQLLGFLFMSSYRFMDSINLLRRDSTQLFEKDFFLMMHFIYLIFLNKIYEEYSEIYSFSSWPLYFNSFKKGSDKIENYAFNQDIFLTQLDSKESFFQMYTSCFRVLLSDAFIVNLNDKSRFMIQSCTDFIYFLAISNK